jgi:hypothetical protein
LLLLLLLLLLLPLVVAGQDNTAWHPRLSCR